MQKIWWLELEYWSGAFSSYEKALSYLMETVKKCGWELVRKDECLNDDFPYAYFTLRGDNKGEHFEFCCWISEYEIDNPSN